MGFFLHWGHLWCEFSSPRRIKPLAACLWGLFSAAGYLASSILTAWTLFFSWLFVLFSWDGYQLLGSRFIASRSFQSCSCILMERCFLGMARQSLKPTPVKHEIRRWSSRKLGSLKGLQDVQTVNEGRSLIKALHLANGLQSLTTHKAALLENNFPLGFVFKHDYFVPVSNRIALVTNKADPLECISKTRWSVFAVCCNQSTPTVRYVSESEI